MWFTICSLCILTYCNLVISNFGFGGTLVLTASVLAITFTFCLQASSLVKHPKTRNVVWNHVTSLDKTVGAAILVFESVSSCIFVVFLNSKGANQQIN